MISAWLSLLLLAQQSVIAADDIQLAQTASREAVPKATASISGHVTCEDGRPLPRAVVHLVNDDTNTSPSVVATTDDAGAYQLPKLLPGRYRVSASKLGFATLEFHQRRPFERGDVVFLDAGEHRDHVDIALFRQPAGGSAGECPEDGPLRAVTISGRHLARRSGRQTGTGTVDRTYQFILNDNEFRERFELAEPGRAFELYSEAHLKRVRERLCDPDHKPPPRVKPVGAS
jgi:hypothetical protein